MNYCTRLTQRWCDSHEYVLNRHVSVKVMSCDHPFVIYVGVLNQKTGFLFCIMVVNKPNIPNLCELMLKKKNDTHHIAPHWIFHKLCDVC